MSPQHPTSAMEEALRRALVERTHSAIAKKNVAFVLKYQHERLHALTMYLKQCQQELGHPPARTEVIGGDYIEMRFGTWEKALLSIGVRDGARINQATPRLEKTQLFQSELAVQRELDRQAKLARKNANKAKMQGKPAPRASAGSERKEGERA